MSLRDMILKVTLGYHSGAQSISDVVLWIRSIFQGSLDIKDAERVLQDNAETDDKLTLSAWLWTGDGPKQH